MQAPASMTHQRHPSCFSGQEQLSGTASLSQTRTPGPCLSPICSRRYVPWPSSPLRSAFYVPNYFSCDRIVTRPSEHIQREYAGKLRHLQPRARVDWQSIQPRFQGLSSSRPRKRERGDPGWGWSRVSQNLGDYK